MGFLKKHIRTGRLFFINAVLCVGLEAFCDLLQPRIMSALIDDGVMKSNLTTVRDYALLMLFITALGAVFATARNILASITSQRFAADLRSDLYEKIQRLPIYDSERFDTGALITRLTNDISQLANAVNGMMRIFFKAPVICVGSVILAATINIRTLPIVLIVVILASVSIALSMRLSYPLFSKVQLAIDKLNTTIREYLMGIRLVRAFGRYSFERKRFANANESLANTSLFANRIISVFSPITNLLSNCGIAAILILGSKWVKTGDMQIGHVVAFISYMTQILFSLSIISNILNMLVRTKVSYLRIAEVMNMTGNENIEDILIANNSESCCTTDSQAMEVSFKNVSFRYPETTGDLALDSIDFTLPKKQMLGVIGPTGSGKSSLASLLLRFYEPTEGHLFINGKDILAISPFQLRKKVIIVPQTPTLFSGTIRENIIWGNENATDDEIIQAAKIADAYDFITQTPNGFETVLGQRGVNLSGGQKQRISIARALCAKPALLILDDATSSLDTLTESSVLNGIKSYSQKLSCIIISQRIATVMRAENILVLNNGNQAGFGKHFDLLEHCKAYSDIYISQMGGDKE